MRFHCEYAFLRPVYLEPEKYLQFQESGNNWSPALQTEKEQQSHCINLDKLARTNSSLQPSHLVDLQLTNARNE